MSVNVGSICNVTVLYYVDVFRFCDKFRNRHMGMKEHVWVK